MVVVLLVDIVLLHPHKWLQQDGFSGTLLSSLSDEKVPPDVHDTRRHLRWLDSLVPFRVHLSVQPDTSRLRSNDSWYLYQLCSSSVSSITSGETLFQAVMLTCSIVGPTRS